MLSFLEDGRHEHEWGQQTEASRIRFGSVYYEFGKRLGIARRVDVRP
jgi:hypothetical protein